jgi:tetratricopeptide (TPR) repeat protein
MDEQRLQAYLELIQKLLACPNGEEEDVLNAHRELADMGLVAVMEAVATQMLTDGQSNNAGFLQDLATQLTHYLQGDNERGAMEFLHQLFVAEMENEDATVAIHNLMRSNLAQVDLALGEAMGQFVTGLLAQQPQETESTAALLGNLCIIIQEFPYGKFLEVNQIALAGYEIVLDLWQDNPPKRAPTLTNRGNAYLTLAKMGVDRVTNFRKAIADYDEAAEFRRSAGLTRDLSDTLNNRGVAYSTLALMGVDGVPNLHKAIADYDEAAEIYRAAELTRDLSQTLNNRGIAYRNLAEMGVDGVTNLHKAIAYYDEAAEIKRAAGLNRDLSQTLNNRGNAYLTLAEMGVDGVINLHKAIAYYDEAAEIYRAAELTRDLSQTLNNRGSAYRNLAQMGVDGVTNLRRAIAYYDEAAEIYRAAGLTRDLSDTLNNRGVAYSTLAQMGVNGVTNLHKAIADYDEAAEFRRAAGLNRDFSDTLNNRGNAYLTLAEMGVDGVTNLHKAIADYDEAAEFRRSAGLTRDLSQTLNNRGNAYLTLAKMGVEPEANNNLASESYRAALQFFNPNTLAADCLITGRILGNLGFKLGNWEIAIEGYSLAIEAIEQSRAWSREESHREEVQSNAIEVYTNIVQALIQLHRYPEALQYAERSRSKRLSDLMRVNDFYQKGEIPTEIKAKLDAYDALQRQIDAIYHKLDGNSQTLTLDTLRPSISAIEQQRVTDLEAQQTTLWQELRRLDPIAAAGKRIIPLEIAEIGQLLGNDNHTALLSFFSTPTDTFIFIARRDSQQQLQIAVHHCPDQGINTFHDAISEEWIKPYYADKNYKEWSKQITPFLQECSDRLSIDTLIAQHLDDTITDLILIPHLYLHQIPFAALPLSSAPLTERSRTDGRGENPLQVGVNPNGRGGSNPLQVGVNPEGRGGYLGDRFTIRYAPSCEILKICDDRPDLNARLNYGIIEGASLDVPYGIFQGEAIATLLNIPPAQRLCGTTEATIGNFKQLAQTVNILHSYHHASSNPNEPLKSSLALADGNITLAQLLVWQLTGLQEVFLSCCETAFGISQTTTDEVFTLASGFLCAGARSVIATLWSVDQLSAALMCIFYYEQRERGLDRPHALQAAQQQLRQLSGATLENVYGERLEACLKINKEQLSRAHDIELTKGEEAAKASFKRLQKVEDMTQNLKYLCGQDRPFADPVYWAAFTCQGLP